MKIIIFLDYFFFIIIQWHYPAKILKICRGRAGAGFWNFKIAGPGPSPAFLAGAGPSPRSSSELDTPFTNQRYMFYWDLLFSRLIVL